MSKKLPVRMLSQLALAEVAGSIVAAIGNMLQTTYNFGVEPDFTLLIVEINSYLENMGATSAIYEDLLRVILSSDSLEASARFCCLQMLLNESVHTLATEIFPFSYYERILHVIAAQGRGLRQLNMKGVWVKEDTLCYMYEIIKHLPHLTKLTIPHIANDNLLKHIGDYSKNLRHLDVSGDTDITEIGLEYLCYGESKNSFTILDIGSLGEENICHTDIALVLMNLPNLVSLASYSFVGQSLMYILEQKNAAFKCKLAYIHDTKTKPKQLDAIVSTCPNLMDLYLDCPESGILPKLTEVLLRRLKLYKFSCSELFTLLEAIGNSVRHLTVIKGRGTLEIHRLVRCCPNLLDLDFYMMDSLTFSGDRGFHDLQGLEMLSSPISQPGLRSLLSLLTTLKRLAIDAVTFDDDDFCSLVIEKDFYRLEDIWFTTAPHMSMASVEMLMDRCPELQSLGQLSGWSLTPDDVSLLRGILKSCNSALMVQSL
ncbi:uncharacterized protein LOC131676753 isoform X2 [Topomyia yanbarensis]|uniref:uncharacterized protein LOC131676753 isoform X2 n=1 Tax=Topomyia yanbarensis TaxID=2498891 RepID=UPI00273C03A2|nr:uncharacterized protein LOC131676753 isoform X2 [Topomyia yanbarensis]